MPRTSILEGKDDILDDKRVSNRFYVYVLIDATCERGTQEAMRNPFAAQVGFSVSRQDAGGWIELSWLEFMCIRPTSLCQKVVSLDHFTRELALVRISSRNGRGTLNMSPKARISRKVQ